MASTLHRSRDDAVLTVRFDNPPANWVDHRVVDELHALVRELERDREVRAVVFAGAEPGRWFTHYDAIEILRGAEQAGVRIGYRAARAATALAALPGAAYALRRTPLRGMATNAKHADALLRLRRLDKVLVAAINGNAIGTGCALALTCDVRIMADGPWTIGIPETSTGFVVPGAMQQLAHLLGTGRAMQVALEARRLAPHEAAELGVVNLVVAVEELEEAAATTARRLAQRSPDVVRALKRTLYANYGASPKGALRSEAASFLAGASTPFARSALTTFVDALGGRAPTPAQLQAAWERLGR